jgi:ketosteroid isomerase-like protein
VHDGREVRYAATGCNASWLPAVSAAEGGHLGLARQLIGALREGSLAGVSELLDDAVVMEMPYAPAGIATRIAGKTAVMAGLTYIERTFRFFRINIHDAYECKDRATVILEATSVGVNLRPAPVYQNRYVFVLSFRDDRVVSWKEFFNPYAVIGQTPVSRS